jgi:hypothetical protein
LLFNLNFFLFYHEFPLVTLFLFEPSFSIDTLLGEALMSYLSRLASGAKRVVTHPMGIKNHVVRHAVETAEYAGASYAFGYIQHKYGEKASLWGVPSDLLGGIAGKVVTLAAQVGGAGGAVTQLTNVIGNAGISAYFHALGAGHGHESKTAALPGTKVKGHILGDLGSAPQPGNFLSAAQLAAMARGR